jgi:hypothetical protein
MIVFLNPTLFVDQCSDAELRDYTAPLSKYVFFTNKTVDRCQPNKREELWIVSIEQNRFRNYDELTME